MSAKGSVRRFGGIPLKTRSPKRRWDPPWPQRNPDRVPDTITRKHRRSQLNGVKIKQRRNPFQFPLPQFNPVRVPDGIPYRQRRNFVRKRPYRNVEGWLFNTFPQTGCQNNILVDQPQGYWPLVFNGIATGTNEVDYSGAQRNLTWTLAPTSSFLEDNAGVNLAGDREASRTGETWQSPKSFTLEWWMQSTGTGAGFMAVVSRRAGNDDWAVYVDRTNGRIQLNWTNEGGVVSQTATTTGVNVLDGSMHHCVVETTYNGADTLYQFYVDTVSRGSGTIFSGGFLKTTLEPFRVCGENGSRQFIGKIANIAFYNWPLPLSRVISHFQCIQGTWNPTTIIVRYPRRYPAWRKSKRIDLPIPQAAAPVAPAYPYQILQAARRKAYRVPRSKAWVPIPSQAAAPPPQIVLNLLRGRLRRGFKPRHGEIFWFDLTSAAGGEVPVKEPIYGILVTDGKTSGILVSDGHTTGLLLTDGRTSTYLIS